MPVLDSIKDNIAKLMEGIEYDINWCARVMGYRNFDIDEKCLLNDNPFVTTVEELNTQLDGMVAKGFAEKEPSILESLKVVKMMIIESLIEASDS